MKQVVNYNFGCYKSPTVWPEEADEVLKLKAQFWNALCERQDKHTDKYFSIVRQNEELRIAEERLEELKTKLSEVESAQKMVRSKLRKSRAKTEYDADVRRLRDEVKSHREYLRPIKQAAKEEFAEDIEILNEEWKQTEKDSYAEFVEKGLWWPNAEDVIERFDAARSKCMREHIPVRVKPKDFKGEGRLAVRLSKGDPANSFMHVIFNGKNSSVSIGPYIDGSDWRELKIAFNGTLSRSDKFVSIPVMLHRDIPEDALVKRVYLSRDRISIGRFEYTATITFATENEDEPLVDSELPKAALDFGWRRDGVGLRVATLADTNGRIRYFRIPENVDRKFDLCERIQSEISHHTNKILSTLESWNLRELNDEFHDSLQVMTNEKKIGFGQLARLLRFWPEELYTDKRKEFEDDLTFQKRERRRLNQTRTNTIAQRNHWMREEIAKMVTEYSVIALDSNSLADLLKKKKKNGEDSPLSKAARECARRASPGEFKAWIIDKGSRSGVPVVNYKGASTWACSTCFHVHTPTEEEKGNLHHTCKFCGTTFDRDENAAKNILSTVFA